jgi:hypothetical protein
VVLSPPATEETGAMGREIESRHCMGRYFFIRYVGKPGSSGRFLISPLGANSNPRSCLPRVNFAPLGMKLSPRGEDPLSASAPILLNRT